MAASRIDLGALQKELDGFRARVERWAQGLCAGCEAARNAHFQSLREFQAEVRRLEQLHEQLERRAEEVQQREWAGVERGPRRPLGGGCGRGCISRAAGPQRQCAA